MHIQNTPWLLKLFGAYLAVCVLLVLEFELGFKYYIRYLKQNECTLILDWAEIGVKHHSCMTPQLWHTSSPPQLLQSSTQIFKLGTTLPCTQLTIAGNSITLKFKASITATHETTDCISTALFTDGW